VLKDISILVVEDEPLTALNIAMEVTGARGNVVGPASSVSADIELIDENEVDGVVLDVHLTDGDVAPVAAQLSTLGVPFLFHRGLGLNSRAQGANPNADVYLKPAAPCSLVKALASLVRKGNVAQRD
jgi:DNA-binding response OmpR family regulator